MLLVFDRFLPPPEAIRESLVLVVGLVAIGFIAFVDYFFGADVRLSALHLLPLAATAYLAQKNVTVAATWLTSITLQIVAVHFDSLPAASIVVDITTTIFAATLIVELARKARESVLHSFQKVGSDKLHAALESMSDAVCISDASGRFIDFNRAFATFHKFKSKEDCAKQLNEYPALIDVMSLRGEQLPLEQWAAARGLRGEMASEVEFKLRLKATGELWIGSYSFAPIREKHGHIVGAVITARDVTQSKRCEEKLRIAAVAFESQDGIVVMDGNHRIMKVNRAFTLLTGFTEQALVAKTMAVLSSARHPPAFYAHIWSEVASTGGWQGDMWTPRLSGDELVAHVTVSAVRDELGLSTHFVCNFSDVTSVRQAEQKRLIDESAHRNLLVREVHHRIKNNLQGITGLLRQLSHNHPALAGDIKKTMSQVQSISLVHGLQGSNVSATINLGDLVAGIARDVGGLWQTKISLGNLPDLQQRTVAENEGVPIALVLNVLVLNALEHGGKAAGEVSITLEGAPHQDAVRVKISNPGLLATDLGHNGKSHSGLQLAAALMPQVGATLTLQQEGKQVVATLELAPPVIETAPKAMA